MELPQPTGLQAFLEYLQFEKRYSPYTLRSYRDDLLAFFEFLQAQYGPVSQLAAIDHNQVRSWLASLKEHELSSRSINRKISSLKSFFKFHLRQGNLPQSPMGKIISPKVSRRLPVFVSEEAARELIAGLDRNTEDWKSLNRAMLVYLFYATGMRLSELIQLRESQVDASRLQIKVLGKGNKERIIPVNAGILEAIEAYRTQKRRVFGTTADTLLVTEKGRKLYPKYAYLLVRSALQEVKTLTQKSPHILRHTFATHLSSHGADLNAIKELLGHSSLAATQVYTHTSIEKLKEIHRKAHPGG
ncbi:MAG TPA: tyrosine-type recombinase/integrase [Chitinophagaceae bacterium]|nr:tyrosine-type recombinase/integrase [Chitinophagaceae bacterium]